MSQAGAHRIPEPVHGHVEPVPHHQVNYFAVFGLLVALTIVTVAVAVFQIKSEVTKVLLAEVTSHVATVKVIGCRWVTGWPSPFVPVARRSKR